MKKPKPTKHNLTVLHQLCNLIPTHLVSNLAREHGVDSKCRVFTAWSHVVSLLFAQLTQQAVHGECEPFLKPLIYRI